LVVDSVVLEKVKPGNTTVMVSPTLMPLIKEKSTAKDSAASVTAEDVLPPKDRALFDMDGTWILGEASIGVANMSRDPISSGICVSIAKARVRLARLASCAVVLVVRPLSIVTVQSVFAGRASLLAESTSAALDEPFPELATENPVLPHAV